MYYLSKFQNKELKPALIIVPCFLQLLIFTIITKNIRKMLSSWRRRVSSRRARKERISSEDPTENMELAIPTNFRCPISLDLMKDPVTLSTGITYDRQSIETWIESGNQTCPITKQELRSLEPIPNHVIRMIIQDWCVENRDHGIERIPTPRIPISSIDVAQILSNFVLAAKEGDQDRCGNILRRIKVLVKESERNKRCFASNGTGTAMAMAIEALHKNVSLLEEGLSILTLMVPLDGEALAHLASPTCLESMVWLLRFGGLSGRRNSVLALKEIVSANKEALRAVGEIDSALEGLCKLIKEPICPSATKACLMVIYHMSTSNNERINDRLVQMGVVDLMLEIIVDADRSTSEKALGVLNGICSMEQGKEELREHSLTGPVLVKKLLRVSDLATEFSVSILWKLGKGEKQGDKVMFDALQVGAFQKLLLLLQVGCGERTKEKATELLKLLNLQRERIECIDSQDFKDLKRTF